MQHNIKLTLNYYDYIKPTHPQGASLGLRQYEIEYNYTHDGYAGIESERAGKRHHADHEEEHLVGQETEYVAHATGKAGSTIAYFGREYLAN